MATYAWLARFASDFDSLPTARQAAFLITVGQFAEDVRNGNGFRNGLHVKGIQGATGIFEMTWADDGRATFEYGPSIIEGETHIIWRRIGTPSIFKNP